MNRRAKFDAASFILGGEIRNRTNTHTDKQTVTDICTPCLSACLDNKQHRNYKSTFEMIIAMSVYSIVLRTV